MPLRVQINKEPKRRFRELAMRRFGYVKGALSKVAEEALMQRVSMLEREPLEISTYKIWILTMGFKVQYSSALEKGEAIVILR